VGVHRAAGKPSVPSAAAAGSTRSGVWMSSRSCAPCALDSEKRLGKAVEPVPSSGNRVAGGLASGRTYEGLA
jgi:hypothetical protein